jgi:cell wall-associated NlpC family hydrolase
VDCSGFTQAVYWLHGLALPRDSDLQAAQGLLLSGDEVSAQARAGDLLFFAEHGRVNHVAISAGDGTIIHSSLSNGGVAGNRLDGELELEQRLRRLLAHGRRMLPD